MQSTPSPGVTGEWLAEQMAARDSSRDSRVEMTMELTDSRGRVTDRQLYVLRKDFDSGSKMLIRFSHPDDIRGTSFLVWEHEEKEAERFLYLPALGRTRRITSAEKTDSFAGTDFSYEDITGRELDDFTYKIIGDTTLASGDRCYILESIPKDVRYEFARIVTLVERESFLPLRAEYYTGSGRLTKRFTSNDRRKISGIWTMTRMTMEDLMNGHATSILVTDVKYNGGIEDRLFTHRELERGAM